MEHISVWFKGNLGFNSLQLDYNARTGTHSLIFSPLYINTFFVFVVLLISYWCQQHKRFYPDFVTGSEHHFEFITLKFLPSCSHLFWSKQMKMTRG
jgi:hypothetical protein